LALHVQHFAFTDETSRDGGQFVASVPFSTWFCASSYSFPEYLRTIR
jgi:hypothetical protein